MALLYANQLIGQKRVELKELYRLATPASGNKGTLRSALFIPSLK